MSRGDRHVHESVNRLELPPDLSAAHLELAAGGAEAVMRRLREHPERMQQLALAVLGGAPDEAQQLLAEMALTEQDVRAEGGDVYLLVVVVMLLWASDAY